MNVHFQDGTWVRAEDTPKRRIVVADDHVPYLNGCFNAQDEWD